MLSNFLVVTNLLLFKKKLSHHSLIPEADTNIEVKFLDSSNCKKIASENQWQANFRVNIDDIIKDSDICAIAQMNRKLAHWTHITLRSAYVDEIEKRIWVSPESAYLKGVYTAKAFRKMGVASTVMEKVSDFLQEKGISEAYILIDQQNHAMLRVSEKAGFKEAGAIKFIKFGLFKIHRYKGSAKEFTKPRQQQ